MDLVAQSGSAALARAGMMKPRLLLSFSDYLQYYSSYGVSASAFPVDMSLLNLSLALWLMTLGCGNSASLTWISGTQVLPCSGSLVRSP